MDTPDIEKDFWKMLESNQFVKSTNSVTDEVEEYPSAIVDMEAIVKINGEFDKYAIDEWLSSRDTYWKEREALTSEREYLRGFREAQYLEKERVRKEVRVIYLEILSRARETDYADTTEYDECAELLKPLLDNLK
jgi:hypothetical protein